VGQGDRQGVGRQDPLQRSFIKAQVVPDGGQSDISHAKICNVDEEDATAAFKSG